MKGHNFPPMEFDPSQLSYLNFKFIKKLEVNKTKATFLFQDSKRMQNLRVIVFEKTDNERIMYKFLKDLHHTRLTETLLYRDSINGFQFLILEHQGPTLGRLFQFLDRKFSVHTVMLLGLNLVR